MNNEWRKKETFGWDEDEDEDENEEKLVKR